MQKWQIGVDEAGRGPLAGPVSVGVVSVPKGFTWKSKLPGVTDSKQLKPEERAEICKAAKLLRHHRELDFTVAMVGAPVIDSSGIMFAINTALKRCFKRLELNPAECSVRLDGSLHAPEEFTQATIIKGDALYPEIGLASIIAKETRDAFMTRIHRRYTQYNFNIHKGYGTKDHRALIAKYGLSPLHRETYCKNIKVL